MACRICVVVVFCRVQSIRPARAVRDDLVKKAGGCVHELDVRAHTHHEHQSLVPRLRDERRSIVLPRDEIAYRFGRVSACARFEHVDKHTSNRLQTVNEFRCVHRPRHAMSLALCGGGSSVPDVCARTVRTHF